MKPLEELVRQTGGLLSDIGQAGLHGVFPNDFEFYAVAIELVNADGETEYYMMFPVMPDSLSINEPNIVSVTKTSGGVTTLFNPTFQPQSITCMGTFGKKFRVLLNGNGGIFGTAYARIKNLKNLIKQGGSIFSKNDIEDTPELSKNIKTGYGATKLLERLLELSKSVDANGRPYYLFFYNLAFNQQMLVEVENASFNQDISSNNGYWRYQFQLKAVAPATAFKRDTEIGGSKNTKKLLLDAIELKTAKVLGRTIRAIRE